MRCAAAPARGARREAGRPGWAIFLALLAPSVLAPGLFAQDSEPAAGARPSVLILTTGGTIASRPQAPTLPGRELVAAVPALEDHARIRVEEFSRIGSSAMTPDHWLRLARRVGRAFATDSALAGVVITHGTDSMEETAYFLHLTVGDARPVVLTGAMRSAGSLSADGPANLLQAVRVAAAPAARGMGTLVVLNGEIHGARAVQKMNNLRLDAFESPGTGALGFADPDTVLFHSSPTRHRPGRPAFDLSGVDALPRVVLVSDYTGADGSALEAGLREGVDGVVVSGFAGGRLSPATGSAVLELARGAVAVAIASRVPGGRILERSVAGEDGPVPMTEAGLVAARDLPPWKARVLLTLALTRTRDADRIQNLFDRH